MAKAPGSLREREAIAAYDGIATIIARAQMVPGFAKSVSEWLIADAVELEHREPQTAKACRLIAEALIVADSDD